MHVGKLVFAQLMELPAPAQLRSPRRRYGGDHRAREFSLDQFVAMAFAQLTYRESLRDIETCLRSHLGQALSPGLSRDRSPQHIRRCQPNPRLAHLRRFAQHLISFAALGSTPTNPWRGTEQTVYALDSTTIDFCLTVFPWAPFRRKAAIKLHTLFDLRGNIPWFIHVSDGKTHDLHVLDHCCPNPAPSTSWTAATSISSACIASRPAPSSSPAPRATSRPSAVTPIRSIATGLRCDQTIVLTVYYTEVGYPDPLRRIRFTTDEGTTLVFLTNNFTLPALTMTELYRCRWQVEFFFKWIKQHLRIKSFFGTTENAVKTQVWIADQRLRAGRHRAQTPAARRLAVRNTTDPGLTMFETTPLHQLLTLDPPSTTPLEFANQLNLFES